MYSLIVWVIIYKGKSIHNSKGPKKKEKEKFTEIKSVDILIPFIVDGRHEVPITVLTLNYVIDLIFESVSTLNLLYLRTFHESYHDSVLTTN